MSWQKRFGSSSHKQWTLENGSQTARNGVTFCRWSFGLNVLWVTLFLWLCQTCGPVIIRLELWVLVFLFLLVRLLVL